MSPMHLPNDPTKIHHPRAYFAAAVSFAWHMAALSKMSIIDALMQYTGLYREVTGRQGLEGEVDPLWADLVDEVVWIGSADEVINLLYNAYLQQPHSRYVAGLNLLNAHIFGALGYVYDATTQQVRTHFFAQRGADSPLASRHFDARRADFRHLLQDVQDRHPDAAMLKSSTWLHNLPTYRNLFPLSFQARLKNIGGSTYLGIWGQFVTADGSSNLARLAEFQTRLQQAHSVDAAIAAFPFPVLEAIGPLHEFYAEYDL